MATVKVALIGTGFAERVQLPAFQRHPRFELVALAARDPARTRAVAERAGLARWYTDWRAMIEAGGLDLLCITAPPHLHREMTLVALDAGLHVLCEKPIALDAEEASEMVERARASGLTAMIDHEFRYLAARQRFGELVGEGYIGELRRLVIRYHTGWRADPQREWDWWSDRARGGGLLGAIGSHYFDACRHWFKQAPRRVWGKVNSFIPARPLPGSGAQQAVTADDAFVALLELESGAEVLFDFTTTACPGTGSRVTALGSEGTLEIVDDRQLLGARGQDPLEELEFEPLPRAEGEPLLLAPFLLLLDDLARGIDKGISPSPNLEDGLAHQLFIDAVRLSSELGSWVDYPPGDERAAALLIGSP